MSNDYATFRNSMMQDLNSAAISARAQQGRSRQKLRLADSDLPTLIPSGADIVVQPSVFTKLKTGELIYVRTRQGLKVRRFIKLKSTAKDSYLTVTHEGSSKKELLPKGALIGKVLSVEHEGKKYNPGSEGLLARFRNLLTEYGTHVPFSGWVRKK